MTNPAKSCQWVTKTVAGAAVVAASMTRPRITADTASSEPAAADQNVAHSNPGQAPSSAQRKKASGFCGGATSVGRNGLIPGPIIRRLPPAR